MHPRVRSSSAITSRIITESRSRFNFNGRMVQGEQGSLLIHAHLLARATLQAAQGQGPSQGDDHGHVCLASSHKQPGSATAVGWRWLGAARGSISPFFARWKVFAVSLVGSWGLHDLISCIDL